jgi:hypothetical protein
MSIAALIAILGLNPRNAPATRDSYTSLAYPLSTGSVGRPTDPSSWKLEALHPARAASMILAGALTRPRSDMVRRESATAYELHRPDLR